MPQPDAAILSALFEALPVPLLLLEHQKDRKFIVIGCSARARELFVCDFVSPEEEITGVLECVKDLSSLAAGQEIVVTEQVADRHWKVHASRLPGTGRKRRYLLTFLPFEMPEAMAGVSSGMLCDMSHELRTPLNAIIGFSELIQNEIFGPLANEQYRNYIGGIRESGLSLLSTINDVLSLADTHVPPPKAEGCDLGNLLRIMRDVYEPRFRKAGSAIGLMIPPGHIFVKGDPVQLEQALFCLMDSCLRLIPEHKGVAVTLNSAAPNGALELMIDLFPSGNRFGRSADTRDYDLFNEQSVAFSLAKKCLRLQRSDMSVTRDAKGHLRILVKLPVADAPAEPVSTAKTQKKVAYSG